MHIISDVLIAVSYFSIPIALIYLANQRPDLMYRWVIYLFGAFIIACGITHITGIWTMWVPDYSIEGLFKVVTAIISVITAVSLWPLMPKLLALPSTKLLEDKNEALHKEISERKIAESELQELNELLETRVTERTQSLTQLNKELEIERAKAEQANVSKSQFLATMSHEIRTPMNGVMGATDILKRTNLTPEQAEFVDVIKESGGSLLALLNDILDLSKIEAGRMRLEEIDISIKELFGAITSLWSNPAQKKGLSLSVRNNLPDNYWIKCDQNRLRQILNNLISNAIKFTEIGEITIELSEMSRQDGTAELLFAVSDSGIGVSEDQKTILFQPFSQADGSTTRKYGGTGLGLSICNNLVDLMGGEMGVESTPGAGSRFWFSVMVEAIDPPGLPARPADNHLDEIQITQGARKTRILVADDNEINRRVVCWILDLLDCQVDTAENGVEAVAAAERADYDLILMDIQMPEMDGIQATRKIRALSEKTKHVPVIALTANAMHGDRENYLKAGMTDYIAKPIGQRELLSTVSRHIAVTLSPAEEVAGDVLARPEPETSPPSDPASDEITELIGDIDTLLGDTKS